MKVEDLRPRGAGWTVRLHEKGGKEHAMPCHHALAEALRAYIDAAGIAEDRWGRLRARRDTTRAVRSWPTRKTVRRPTDPRSRLISNPVSPDGMSAHPVRRVRLIEALL